MIETSYHLRTALQCARPGCSKSPRLGDSYCCQSCGVSHRAALAIAEAAAAPPPITLLWRRCQFDQLHAYVVRAGSEITGYCRPACAAAAMRHAIRRERAG